MAGKGAWIGEHPPGPVTSGGALSAAAASSSHRNTLQADVSSRCNVQTSRSVGEDETLAAGVAKSTCFEVGGTADGYYDDDEDCLSGLSDEDCDDADDNSQQSDAARARESSDSLTESFSGQLHITSSPPSQARSSTSTPRKPCPTVPAASPALPAKGLAQAPRGSSRAGTVVTHASPTASQATCSTAGAAATATSTVTVTATAAAAKRNKVPALAPSLFVGCNPAIYFPAEHEEVVLLPKALRSLLRWRMSTITPNVIKSLLKKCGFTPTKRKGEWLGYWGKHMKSTGFRSVQQHQKTNHFPGSFCIGRKDNLWARLLHMQLRFGRLNYDFFPQTFVLPRDTAHLQQQWDDSGKQKWIIKPPASARGIGIHVVNKWSQLPRRRSVIVQRYLDKPYLINESKFDLRVYVYVSSYDPLRIYVYDDGLVRFATCKYKSSSKHISNRYMHLTNYSINKKNTAYSANSDETLCQGSKWGLKALWRYFDEHDVDSENVWTSIIDVVVKTIIASDGPVNSHVKANVARRSCVHELFGFDIFLDVNLKPFVLEVNISPSLHSNSQLDLNIKGGMLRDLLNMACFQLPCQQGTECGKVMQSLGYPANWSRFPSPGVHLQTDDRAKHAYYANCHAVKEIRETVLEHLTPDDLRMLMESEDEFQRRGDFLRVFPTTDSKEYDNFFDIPRYYNVLLSEWLQQYRSTPALDRGSSAPLRVHCLPLPATHPGAEHQSNAHTRTSGVSTSRRHHVLPPPHPLDMACSCQYFNSSFEEDAHGM